MLILLQSQQILQIVYGRILIINWMASFQKLNYMGSTHSVYSLWSLFRTATCAVLSHVRLCDPQTVPATLPGSSVHGTALIQIQWKSSILVFVFFFFSLSTFASYLQCDKHWAKQLISLILQYSSKKCMLYLFKRWWN